MGDIPVAYGVTLSLFLAPSLWYTYFDERSAVGNRAVDSRGDSFASGGVHHNATDTAHYDAAQGGREGGQCAGL